MSRGDKWIPIDKNLAGTFRNINRPFSDIEAMFSFTLDHDNDNEWTYRGYAKLWQWSVGKVKRFVDGMRNSSGTVVGRKGNGSGTLIHFIDRGLWALEKQKRNNSGTVDEHMELPTTNPNPKPKGTTSCPHQKIIFSYNSILSQLPEVKSKLWNGTRRTHLAARWKEDKERQNLIWWKEYFESISSMPFLCGDNDRNWKADLGWLINQNNMIKVLEGKYDPKKKGGSKWA